MASVYANRNVSATGLVGAGFAMLARQWRVWLALGAINVVLQTLQKTESSVHFGGTAVLGLVTLSIVVLQFVIGAAILRVALQFEGLVTTDAPIRFLAFLGVSIVIGLAEGLGFALFIIPGFMIAVRWLIAPTFVLARGLGVGEALDASRDATDGHRWSIFGALVLTGLIAVIPFLAIFAAAGSTQAFVTLPWNSGLGLLSALVGLLFGVFFNAMILGIYATLSANEGKFDEVFG
jgi:hypothetical protein